MSHTRRVLDPCLAVSQPVQKGFYGQSSPMQPRNETISRSLSRRNKGNSLPLTRISSRRRPTRRRPMRRAEAQASQKQTVVDLVQNNLTATKAQIDALKLCKDPYAFDKQVVSIRRTLTEQKDVATPSGEVEELNEQVRMFEKDRDVIASRLETILSERMRVEGDLEAQKENVEQLQLQLKNARANLSSTQRIFEDLEKVHFDSQKEQKTIMENLAAKKAEVSIAEENNKEHQTALNLVLDMEATLNEATKGIDSIREEFLSQWRTWTPEQMVQWMCQQSPDYEKYRANLSEKILQQVQNGSDFAYFDSHVLLGLGIALIRHRGELLKSIQELTGGSRL